MTKPRVAHLLDDFAMGGVTKALEFYESSRLAGAVQSRTVAIRRSRVIAPRLEADAIVIHFPPNWRRLPFLWTLRIRNHHARLIHVEHSYTRTWETLKVGNRRRFRLMLRLGYAAAHAVVAVSEAQAAWLSEVGGIDRSKLTVIHPWSGQQGLERLSPARPMPGDPIVLGAYGRFSEQKGFDVLIAAMRQLPPGRFRLLLGGFGEDENALRALSSGLSCVEFYGKVTDLPDFIGRCDAVVIPSRWEAFGQVAAEAKLGGRAIIVADVDGLPEQAKGFGIVADCSNATALAAALVSVRPQFLARVGRDAADAMKTVEQDRLHQWKAFFHRILFRDDRTARRATRSAQPMMISPGQIR